MVCLHTTIASCIPPVSGPLQQGAEVDTLASADSPKTSMWYPGSSAQARLMATTTSATTTNEATIKDAH